MLHDSRVLLDLRWRAVPFLVPLGILALLPALAIWAAAILGSLAGMHLLDALPTPAAAFSPFERLMRLSAFWSITLGGPMLALVAGAAAALDAELRIEHWEISARLRLAPPPWTHNQLIALAVIAIGALLFMAMAGHLAADCLIGGDCRVS